MSKMGRPTIMESTELTIEQVKLIMLDHAVSGGFLATLPAQIWKKTNVMVSLSYIEKIKEDDFLRAKAVAKALCGEYWNSMMLQAAIPSAVWIFIAKNVMEWRDYKDVKIESNQSITTQDISVEEAKKELERLKLEIAENV